MKQRKVDELSAQLLWETEFCFRTTFEKRIYSAAFHFEGASDKEIRTSPVKEDGFLTLFEMTGGATEEIRKNSFNPAAVTS